MSEGEDLVIDDEFIADAELVDAALEEEDLVFYTGGSEQSEAALADEFTEDTGIPVEIIRLAPNRLAERVLSEQGADMLGADVIRTSGEDLTLDIAESDAFDPHDIPEELEIPEEHTFDDGAYYRSFDRVYSITYNTQAVDEDEAPQDWADLLDDSWADGELGLVQVAAGGSTAALTRFHLEELGEDYLRDLAEQDPRIFDSAGGVADAVARGEVSVATLPIATTAGTIAEGAPLEIVTPEEGAAAFSYYLGVATDADNPASAQVFMNWSMSQRGQEASGALGDYPVREDVADPSAEGEELPSVDSDFLHRYDAEETLEHVESDAELWREIFGYTE